MILVFVLVVFLIIVHIVEVARNNDIHCARPKINTAVVLGGATMWHKLVLDLVTISLDK